MLYRCMSQRVTDEMDKPTVLDGDFENELRRQLKPSEQTHQAFALRALESNPYAVYKTHLAHLRAGARIIRTNTYRASLQSFCQHLEMNPQKSMSMITEAVKLAQKAVFKYYEETGGDTSDVLEYNQRRPLIAGTCGSYNASIFPNTSMMTDMSDVSTLHLWGFHKWRVNRLSLEKVDVFAFESIPTWKETEVIIETLRDYPQARAWITFSCTQDGRLLDKKSFATVAVSCYDALPGQFVAFGAECESLEAMKPFMNGFHKRTKIPFVFYIGKSRLQTTGDTGECSAEQQRNLIQELVDVGVRYIGGGTGTVTEDIKEIREQVDNYLVSSKTNFTAACSYRNDDNQSKL